MSQDIYSIKMIYQYRKTKWWNNLITLLPAKLTVFSSFEDQSSVRGIFLSFPLCFVQRLTDHLLFTHAHSWFAAVFFWVRQLRYQLFSSAALICPTAIRLSSFYYPFMNVSPFRPFMRHLSLPIRANLPALSLSFTFVQSVAQWISAHAMFHFMVWILFKLPWLLSSPC